MKRIKVQLAGGEGPAVEISLMPGVTAGEILEALNLEGACVLWAGPNHPFSEEEAIYDRVTDGDRLYVSVRRGC